MAGTIRIGLYSLALFGTVLFAQAVRSAPPEVKKGEDDAKAAARKKLSEKGIHVSPSGLSLIDEKQLNRAFGDANALKRKLQTVAKELQAGEKNIEQIQADMRQRLEVSVQINSMLASVRNNPVEHNRLAGEVNVNNSELKLLEQNQEETKKALDAVRKKSNAAREAYVQQIAEIRALVDRLSDRYAALKSDADAQAALAEWNSAADTSFTIKPSSAFLNYVKKLEQLEKTVISEKIPLRREGNSYYATVVVNGKAPQDMIVDTGANSVVLPYKVALECGLKPEESAVTVIATVADGSKVKSKLVNLESVRVGKFTAENVECVVLPAEAKNAPMLLGMTFLSKFNFSINGTELILSKIEGEHATTKPKKTRASRAGRKSRRSDKSDKPIESDG